MDNIRITRNEPNITVSEPRADYHLPIASSTVLGGIKVGNNLTITEDGTLSAESTEYNLPMATASTLGGIKVGENLAINDGVLTADVDSVLNTASTNPIQNSTITNALNATISDVSALDTRLDSAEDNISANAEDISEISQDMTLLSTTVDNLSDDVENNTANISGNTSAINQNTLDIADLDDRLDTAETNITNQGNAINEMAGEINDFTLESDTEVDYSYLLPVNVWGGGSITYSRRGKNGLIQFDLTGVYDLQSEVNSQIYQLPETFQNAVACTGVLITNDGCIEVKLDMNRNIKFYNHDAETKHIIEVKGQLTVVLE